MEQKNRPYSVEEYDPKWLVRYERERAILSRIFGKLAIQIDHIGSTSVEGLSAKPQVDIQVVVDSLSVVDDKLTNALIKEGYNYQGDSYVVGEKYFTRDAPNGERTVSVHVRAKGNPSSIAAIYFRDYLRTHPKERDIYSKAKMKAYNAGKTDRAEYPLKKKKVLTKLLENAKKWNEAKNKKSK